MHRTLRLPVVRNTLAGLGVALLLALGSRAVAQRIASDPERSQPGIVLDGPPLAFGAIRTQAPRWDLDLRPFGPRIGPDPQPIFGAGLVYLDAGEPGDPRVVAVDPRNGATVWNSADVNTPLAYRSGLVYVEGNSRFDVSRIVALDGRNGRIRWATPGSSMFLVRQLAIVTNEGWLEARDAVSGQLRWSTVWNGSEARGVQLTGTTLLVRTIESGATMVGMLYAFDVRDGRALWSSYSTNAVLGVLSDGGLILDTTWGNTYDYAGLSVKIVAPANGQTLSSYAYAPDRDRWLNGLEGEPRTGQSAFADASSLIFRIGPGTVYRYPLRADPHEVGARRYEFGALAHVTGDTWLVRPSDGAAALATIDATGARLAPITGFDGVEFVGAGAGLAIVAARDRAVVFDPRRPADAALTRIACAHVSGVYPADGAILAVCASPGPRVLALALPAASAPAPQPTAVPLRAPPQRHFSTSVHAFDVQMGGTKLAGVAFGRDGTLWFAEPYHSLAFRAEAPVRADALGHVRTDGSIEEFPVPTADGGIAALARGSDGAMWFTESVAMKVGRIDANGAIAEFSLPSDLRRMPVFSGMHTGMPIAVRALPTPTRRPLVVQGLTFLGGIAAAADGAAWVTVPRANAIMRVTPAGLLHTFALPRGVSHPDAITPGPDGALWFTTREGVGRITSNGSVETFSAPSNWPQSSIVWGPDGNLWFSFFDGRIGRVTPKGAVRIFPAPVIAAASGPLIGGCDGAIYIADRNRGGLWRMTTHGAFQRSDLPYPIESLARSANCTFGFSESQGPMLAHVGTILIEKSAADGVPAR